MVMKKFPLVAADYGFIFLSILATALSLAGYFGRYNLYLEFVSGYKLQYLLVGMCSLIYFALTRRQKIIVAIALVGLLLNLVEIVPWYFHRPQITNLESYYPLKVLSYNVLWDNKQYDQAIALIDRQQPDIAVFQEAQAPWAKALSVLKSDYPYQISVPKLEIEVHSKFPLENTHIELYGTYRGLVISDLTIGDRQVKFIATHAYPQLYFGHQGWTIRNQHLEIGIGAYVRQLSLPVIVIGDLNVTMWSPFYRSMIQTSGLYNARQGFGILPTQSAIAPQLSVFSAPIDHCLISPEILVQDFQLGNNIGSDHLPIIADLLIPKKM